MVYALKVKERENLLRRILSDARRISSLGYMFPRHTCQKTKQVEATVNNLHEQ